jgi:hypothetical protein
MVKRKRKSVAFESGHRTRCHVMQIPRQSDNPKQPEPNAVTPTSLVRGAAGHRFGGYGSAPQIHPKTGNPVLKWCSYLQPPGVRKSFLFSIAGLATIVPASLWGSCLRAPSG